MTPNEAPYALITGASSGIGAAFARRLATAGYNLVLTARRRERLDVLATEIIAGHAVHIETICADLAKEEDIASLESHALKYGHLEILVNNAGFGMSGMFVDLPIDKHIEMIQVHLHASVRLTHTVLPGMLQRRRGAIINVASLAGLLPLRNSTYGATKAYLIVFSQALQREVAPAGLHVQALCPGFTHTEFHDRRELSGLHRTEIPRFMWGSAEEVVEHSLKSLARGKVVCIPGRLNRAIVFFGRTPLTSGLIRYVAARRYRKSR